MSILTDLFKTGAVLESVEASSLYTVRQSLLSAFQVGGDFPSSSEMVRQINLVLGRREASVAEIASLISKDPCTALRLVSLVNFPAFLRGKPSVNVTAAVNQLGIKQVSAHVNEGSGGKDFSQAFNGRATALNVFTRILCVAELAGEFVSYLSPRKNLYEETVIAGLLSNLPELLLAYYKPNLYGALVLEGVLAQSDFSKSFKKLFKITTNDFALELAGALSLPREYTKILSLLNVPPWNKKAWGVTDWEDARPIATSVYFANAITAELNSFQGKEPLLGVLKDLASRSEFKMDYFTEKLQELPSKVAGRAAVIGISPLALPSYLRSLSQAPGTVIPAAIPAAQGSAAEKLKSLLLELNVCLKAKATDGEIGRLGQAVNLTFLALVKVMNFDRAVLMVYDESAECMKTLSWFGFYSIAVTTYRRKLTHPEARYLPDLQAYLQKRAVFTGDPVLDDAYPFAAFPVVCNGASIGVFYADRASKVEGELLSMEDQLAVVALAEAWQHMPEDFR